MVKLPHHIDLAAAERIVNATQQRERALRAAQQGSPWRAADDHARRVRHIERMAGVTSEVAEALARSANPRELGLTGEQLRAVETILGDTNDLMGVVFLERARKAADAVCRLVLDDGAAHATGFLISDRLLLTNHHAIESTKAAAAMQAEFNFEFDQNSKIRPVTRFRLDPAAFFATNSEDDLDYTLVALGERVDGGGTAAGFGACKLTDADTRLNVGEFVNVVQHPNGDHKQVVLRENRVVTLLAPVVHYRADTDNLSSGSPVFDDRWNVVAIHHYGGPFRVTMLLDKTPVPQDVNEGIRVSAIVRDLRARAEKLEPGMRALLEAALAAGGGGVAPAPGETFRANGPNVALNGGTASVTVPLHVSVSLGDPI